MLTGNTLQVLNVERLPFTDGDDLDSSVFCPPCRFEVFLVVRRSGFEESFEDGATRAWGSDCAACRSATILGDTLRGRSDAAQPKPGSVTDVGSIQLRRLPPLGLFASAHNGPDGPATRFTIDPASGSLVETGVIHAALKCGGTDYLGTIDYQTGVVSVIGASVPGMDVLSWVGLN